jgi:hypothetical protein
LVTSRENDESPTSDLWNCEMQLIRMRANDPEQCSGA